MGSIRSTSKNRGLTLVRLSNISDPKSSLSKSVFCNWLILSIFECTGTIQSSQSNHEHVTCIFWKVGNPSLNIYLYFGTKFVSQVSQYWPVTRRWLLGGLVRTDISESAPHTHRSPPQGTGSPGPNPPLLQSPAQHRG